MALQATGNRSAAPDSLCCQRPVRVLQIRQIHVHQPLQRPQRLHPLVPAAVIHHRHGQPGRQRRQYPRQEMGRRHQLDVVRPLRSAPRRSPAAAPWRCPSRSPRRRMSPFWQYTHPRVQPEKNTVPAPFCPEIGGSSQWCSMARATRSPPGIRQKPPPASAVRSAPHRRGHSVQIMFCGCQSPAQDRRPSSGGGTGRCACHSRPAPPARPPSPPVRSRRTGR